MLSNQVISTRFLIELTIETERETMSSIFYYSVFHLPTSIIKLELPVNSIYIVTMFIHPFSHSSSCPYKHQHQMPIASLKLFLLFDCCCNKYIYVSSMMQKETLKKVKLQEKNLNLNLKLNLTVLHFFFYFFFFL